MSPRPNSLPVPGTIFGLIDDRGDGSGDQVPVLAEADWDDRLDVKDVLGVVARPDAEVGVVLQRKADHVGHRVLGSLGQGGLVVRTDIAVKCGEAENNDCCKQSYG